MAEVDAEDDSITRYVARHYRFDPERRERRHVVVGVYDNEREWRNRLDAITADIARRRSAGEDVDRREHSSGTLVRPGDREHAATAHLVRRAMEHGVHPADILRERELPSSMVVFDVEDSADRFSFGDSSTA
jgi:hypothetical protein